MQNQQGDCKSAFGATDAFWPVQNPAMNIPRESLDFKIRFIFYRAGRAEIREAGFRSGENGLVGRVYESNINNNNTSCGDFAQICPLTRAFFLADRPP